MVPPPGMATYTPLGESRIGAAGDDPATFSDGKHQHPRMSSSTPVTLDGTGSGTVTFSRSFPTEPLPAFARMPGGTTGPSIFEVESWVMSGSDYVGANVKGYRLSPPVTQTAATVLGISLVISGQPIVTYGPASGAKVSVIMLPNSTS